MKNQPEGLISVLLAMTIASLVLMLLFTGCDMKPSSSEMGDADRLIKELDVYVKKYGKTPTNEEAWKIMNNLGLRSDESCRPCYQQVDNKNYLIWFGLTLGESYTYSSSSKEWY